MHRQDASVTYPVVYPNMIIFDAPMHGPVGVPTYVFSALLTDQVSQVLTTVGCDMRTDSSSGVIVGYGPPG